MVVKELSREHEVGLIQTMHKDTHGNQSEIHYIIICFHVE